MSPTPKHDEMTSWTCITGAAVGLGRAIALKLAEQGHALVLHYHTHAQEAKQLAALCREKGAEAECIEGDFSSHDGVLRFLERYLAAFGATKYLVNNVGNVLRQTALETSDNEWKALFQSNFHAPCQIINTLSDTLKHHRGAIVNIGFAGVSQAVLSRQFAAYHTTKMALWTLTKSLADALAPHGVRVNMVSPGFLENSIHLPDPQHLPKMVPMGRLGTLEEVASVVAFLLDPMQAYVTGQNIDVAGGVRL